MKDARNSSTFARFYNNPTNGTVFFDAPGEVLVDDGVWMPKFLMLPVKVALALTKAPTTLRGL